MGQDRLPGHGPAHPSTAPGQAEREAAIAALRQIYPGAETFVFGDSRALCETLLALVRRGAKTATCGALRDFGTGGEPMPVAGRHDIALDWEGWPALVIETTEVTVRRFRDVDADFALAEGEDRDLAGWREGHRRYFERNGGWSDDMDLVCERFRIVADLGPARE